MRSTTFGTIGLGVVVAFSVGLGACGGSGSSGGTGGSGGGVATGGNPATGGNSSTGGTVGTGGSTTGTGGKVATGGTTGTGGSTGSGGATGGSTGTGGTTGGAGHGGGPGTAGMAGGGAGKSGGAGKGGGAGMSGGAGTTGTGTGGSGTGTGGTGTCTKGQTKGSDVVIMGESFYAISPQYIQNRVQDDARMAGSLGASDTYRNVAVSGQNMNYIATTEWTAATQGGAAPKYVIMDGGGIDCLSGSSCPTCQATLTTLLGKMGTAGVKQVIYTRYPEPGNPPGSNTSLKACLDATMPGMQTACEGSTSPVCHFLDLRPVWVNGDTSDGLHPTQSGGDHVGDLIWSEMMKDCIAQ